MYLTPSELKNVLNKSDLTNPAHGHHALQLVVQKIQTALHSYYKTQPVIYRADPIVKITDNYDRLRIGPDSISRDKRYTRYVDADHMLRSHTSAMIPKILDELSSSPLDRHLILCPGLVYRRDQIDRTHTGEPHQMDIWLIQKEPLDVKDLLQLIQVVLNSIDPNLPQEILLADHPYTLQGREMYLGDLEVGECGLAHPEVLKNSNLESYHGLAMGIGLDRILMLLKNIDDIRLLRSEDERITSQMQDLNQYRPISMQPATKRDMSLALDVNWDLEILGDIARNALGGMSEWIEDVAVLSETSYQDLPIQARERLGILENQVNVLIRITLRHPTKTLTSEITNTVRRKLYLAWHQGSNDVLA